MIASLVNDNATKLDIDFSTNSLNQKRFYCLRKDDVYACIYFDIVFTIDNDKIRQTLSDILKTYVKLTNEGADSGRLKPLIDYQFNQLVQLQSSHVPASTESTPEPSVPLRSYVSPKKSGKKMRKWIDGQLVDEESDTVLDFSESKQPNEIVVDTEQLKVDNSVFKRENNMVLVDELNAIIGQDDDDEEPESTTQDYGPGSSSNKTFLAKFTSYFSSSADIDDLAKKFNEQMILKNIAPQTSTQILETIKFNLKGKKVTLPLFKQTLADELTKILSPNVSTDLLYDIKSNSNRSRPYVISIVGVNGVGKSTNLAKLAYWLLQNDINVLICACDTFRSGAVEQLKVHVTNLKTLNQTTESNGKIDIFEKGYGGGDHVVATAKAAIEFGTREHYDVILIDTAGRTHSNAKLMAPLKKFGDVANPDKIIMVGEALVGTDSVEQAINFNNAFGNKRKLDFFIISKVDTVGDLVGTMINMVMATNVPILFMGTGQTYTDIKRLNVNLIVDMLIH